MSITYNPLWSYMSKKNISKNTLQDECNLSKSTMTKLRNDRNISFDTLNRICDYLDCEIKDIIVREDDYYYQTTLFDNVEVTNNQTKLELNSSLDTISLFSGAGGLDLGLAKSGFNIIYANDNYAPAAENYAYNIGPISTQDIQSIDAKELPDADVVVGGFPCQPFSSAGNRRGTDDDRGNLYLDMIRIIAEKKPKVVIMENVRGLLSMKNKDKSLLIDSIVEMLANIEPGYNVKYKLLKASNYGVPQNRYRVFIVAFRSDLNIDYKFPDPYFIPQHELTVGYAINLNTNTLNQNEVWELSPQSQHLVNFIPEGGSWKDVPYNELPDRLKKIRDNMKKYRSPNFYRRFARNEINGTITAAATPENSGILHPTENRRYSVREIARIQSFPDNYEFIGSSIPAKYKIIGNAVPPKLAKAVGDSVIKALHKIGY
ncbi:DNA (cytosine-5-)-methyltransferase [Aerococcus sp. UMB7834]|uniref:DNA (cytosine-5-)-methyltransferase n=1 Tax=Aerococcus sp. UMB7834 TaxID=3046342 RepID=UPI00254A9D7F|nr:DNA (cytosine-5-)-methyltransferase [Aerococcus sp. UMB7834]MDK6804746.1 DNA (cytosine-5-)-methyltransferase [Aerococcus sp. UMB7834]